MADDWQVGDLALCVNATDGSQGWAGSLLREGAVYTVENASMVCFSGEHVLVLNEVKAPDYTEGFNVTRFIKITPPEADEFDREVIELLRREPVPSMKDRIV